MTRRIALTMGAVLAASVLTAGVAGAGEPTPGEQSLVAAFGTAATAAAPLESAPWAESATAIETDPDSPGYWVAATDGGVFSYDGADFHGSAGALDLNGAIFDIEAAPSGDGYWLAAADGGVFAFGDAGFHGSAGDLALDTAILAITATPSGNGYWLAAADGGVFAFGDAGFHGSAGDVDLASPVVDLDTAPSGNGYWLLTNSGEVLAFGDAQDHGDPADLGLSGATAIGASPDGGYHVTLTDGRVISFETEHFGSRGDSFDPRTVDAAVAADGGYLTLRNPKRSEPLWPTVDPAHPFLVCTRAHESDGAGGYRAVNPSGKYRGAYQFSRDTWNRTAEHAQRFDLVGVDPAVAAPADQDYLAMHLYEWQGASPWLGRCSGL